MDTVERLMKSTVAELERLLNAKNVLGDPIDRENGTVIPIVSYGFGFGAGAGAGGEGSAQGSGGMAAAGGGIKPVGAVIIDADGARVEGIKGMVLSLAEVLGDTATKVLKSTARAVSKAAEGKAAEGKAGDETPKGKTKSDS